MLSITTPTTSIYAAKKIEAILSVFPVSLSSICLATIEYQASPVATCLLIMPKYRVWMAYKTATYYLHHGEHG